MNVLCNLGYPDHRGGGGGVRCRGGESGLPSFNRVFKPVLNLTCYIRYYIAQVLKPGLYLERG